LPDKKKLPSVEVEDDVNVMEEGMIVILDIEEDEEDKTDRTGVTAKAVSGR
jgi:hypothetical protein